MSSHIFDIARAVIHMQTLWLALATLMLLQVPAHGARDLGHGALPIAFEPMRAITLRPDDEIIIEGRVHARRATLVLRIDDRPQPDYGSRSNKEYQLRPGPFRIIVKAKSLTSSNGRTLDLKRIYRIIAFTTGNSGRVTATRFTVHPTNNAPPSTAHISLGRGKAPIKYAPSVPFDARSKVFHFEGINRDDKPITVLLRVDDQSSIDYSSRANIERTIPPGPFAMKVPADGLQTPRKRVLQTEALRLAILTPWPATRDLEINRFELVPVATLPKGVSGYAFGAPDSTLPAGFTRIAPGDRRISGDAVQVRRRPKPDPLIANGLRGITEIRLQTTPGPKRITIWSEDPGEWEHLPASRQRKITVNNKTLLTENLTSEAWLEQVYLKAGDREHTADMDAWTAFGQHRGNPRTIEVPAPDGRIIVRFKGATYDDRFINAVLVEPADTTSGLTFVRESRAEWYRANWRITPAVKAAAAPQSAHASNISAYRLDVAAPSSAQAPTKPKAPNGKQQPTSLTPVRIHLAPGTGARATLAFRTTGFSGVPKITLDAPRNKSAANNTSSNKSPALSLKAWAGQWRFDRTEPQNTILNLRDDLLRADLAHLPITSDRPRRYELWIEAPEFAEPGSYRGHMTVMLGDKTFKVPLEATVLGVTLPKVAKPAGFYLGYAPHLSWFRRPQSETKRQASCDLDFLTRAGLTGTAPPVSVPFRGGTEQFENEMSAAKRAGLAPGWLAYNPIHHLRTRYGTERAAKFAAAADNALRDRGITPPVWSAADEPSNPDQAVGDLGSWIKALRSASDGKITLGGHLNAKADAAVANLFDVLILNPSFGIDRNAVAGLADGKRSVWYYNTFQPRLTAGLWLHFSEAKRYVQWHARMPTANPFDPIDGREGDVQVLYPSIQICNDQPDIHRNLLRLAEGVVDQRWLQWLSHQPGEPARKLYADIRRHLPNSWTDAAQKSTPYLNAVRQQILQLAGAHD